MAIGDITVLAQAGAQEAGAYLHNVDNNTSGQGTGASYTKAFRPGEPVSKTLGNAFVTTLTAIGTGGSAKPVVATDFLAGIATTTSTEDETNDGIVYVQPIVPGTIYLGNPDAPTSFDTQSEYNALVGDRVLIKMSTSTTNPVFTILASDSATSGLVIEPLDISKYPGKVAFSLRQGLSYTI